MDKLNYNKTNKSNLKIAYKTPECEVIDFNYTDIISTSIVCGPHYCEPYNPY